MRTFGLLVATSLRTEARGRRGTAITVREIDAHCFTVGCEMNCWRAPTFGLCPRRAAEFTRPRNILWHLIRSASEALEVVRQIGDFSRHRSHVYSTRLTSHVTTFMVNRLTLTGRFQVLPYPVGHLIIHLIFLSEPLSRTLRKALASSFCVI